MLQEDFSPWAVPAASPTLCEEDFPPLSVGVALAGDKSFEEELNPWKAKPIIQEEEPVIEGEGLTDYELALKLQQEYSLLDAIEEEEVPEEEIEADENISSDYALALELQKQLNSQVDSENDHSIRSHNRTTFEKVRLSGKKGSYEEGPYTCEDETDEDEERYESDYQERYHNPHAPTSYTGVSGKLYHQVSKTHGRKDKKVVTKHDPVMNGIDNAHRLEHFVPETGDIGNLLVENGAFNSIRKTSTKQHRDTTKRQANKKDKSAHDSVIDQQTRINLFKLLNGGVLEEFNGVISTGKESHVYHGVSGPNMEGVKAGTDVAIKIFSLDMVKHGFKDRSKYVDGEFRYRHVATQNSRQAIKVWAEKELRNLKRIQSHLSSPTPYVLKKNILVMSFLGKGNVPAPRLKDAQVSVDKYHILYLQCIKMMRKMYQKCDLVHADLSEYNILYHRSHLWFIDVSQAIENDHPNAMEFLRRDCKNITTFFRKKGVRSAMSTKQLFDFITDKNITSENIDDYLDAVQEQNNNYDHDEQNSIFNASLIPRKLSDIQNPHFELDQVQKGEKTLYSAVTGISSDLSCVMETPEILSDKENKQLTDEP
eukprot:CAMPEP_0174269964 /NCGR_PEP_ID=MMETSP0439-20130205/42811_1 /TAXON_ID=0 /ORGANISM="Stereomyxa ramosa, Strain Chinc5" /LENGTH=595 /DNA_ID=CAMNT_0015359001 /DNA_START=42 /DNA_END=1829 /DNA_ORIENTATION=+